MAAMIASKGSPASKLLEKLVSPVRSVAASSPCTARSFNTSSQMRDPEEERSLDVDRRSDAALSRRRGNAPFPTLFSDIIDPFMPAVPARSVNQMLNLMDRMLDSPFTAASRGMGSGLHRGWDAKEDENGLHLRIEMPGLGKEDVKVWVEENTLVIKGEAEKEKESEEEEESTGRRYTSRIELPPKLYKVDEIKAEMKNGVLKVFVPKVKDEERKDKVEIPIE